MKIAAMHPYLLPYLGYFRLVAAVDRGWHECHSTFVEGLSLIP